MKQCNNCGRSFVAHDWICPNCERFPITRDGFLSFLPDCFPKHDAFDSAYYPMLFELEGQNFWFQHRNNLLIWFLRTLFPKAESLMEIGCGTGYVLSNIHRNLPHLSLSGADIYLEGLCFARERVPGAEFYQLDACNMPFSEEFDLIGVFDLLEHIEDDQQALKEIHKSLKKGGGIILTVPQHKWLWSIQDEKAFHKRRYVKNALANKMKQTGFRVILSTSFISLLLPVLMISRVYSSMILRAGGQYDEMCELRLNPAINRILCNICIREENAIKRGFRLPFGGSLLCIGKKD